MEQEGGTQRSRTKQQTQKGTPTSRCAKTCAGATVSGSASSAAAAPDPLPRRLGKRATRPIMAKAVRTLVSFAWGGGRLSVYSDGGQIGAMICAYGALPPRPLDHHCLLVHINHFRIRHLKHQQHRHRVDRVRQHALLGERCASLLLLLLRVLLVVVVLRGDVAIRAAAGPLPRARERGARERTQALIVLTVVVILVAPLNGERAATRRRRRAPSADRTAN